MTDTAKAKSLVKPLVWAKWQMGHEAYALNKRYSIIVKTNGTISAPGLINEPVFENVEAAKAAYQSVHDGCILSTLDLTAYRREVLEKDSQRRFLKAPEPVARPDDEWCRKYAEWHEARYGGSHTATIRALAEQGGK